MVARSVFQEHPKLSIASQNALICVSIICVMFMTAEVIGGYLSNSIAIMSDAAHLLSDLLSFFVGIISIKLTMRSKDPPDIQYSNS